MTWEMWPLLNIRSFLMIQCAHNYYKVSAAADRPVRGDASGPPCCIQLSMVSVINSCSRPSPVYHTDLPTELTAHETISYSRGMVGVQQNLTGSRDLTTPLSGTVCHTWTSTCYCQPTYQIWSLYLHSLWRYERRYKMSRMGWFGVVRISEEVTRNSTNW